MAICNEFHYLPLTAVSTVSPVLTNSGVPLDGLAFRIRLQLHPAVWMSMEVRGSTLSAWFMPVSTRCWDLEQRAALPGGILLPLYSVQSCWKQG